jgi:anaphase-promoting complex subunit 2
LKNRFGSTVFSAYTLNFQTRLFSLLPPSFSAGFKNLCACLLAPPSPPSEDVEDSFPVDSSAVIPTSPYCDPNIKATIWKNIEVLGLIDRYESIIASVGYEFIEDYVLKMCTGEWAKPMLEDLRVWMSEKVVPWMLHVYARGATNGLVSVFLLFSSDAHRFWIAEEARSMLQGVGSRFDFHINKTLCDLRFVY